MLEVLLEVLLKHFPVFCLGCGHGADVPPDDDGAVTGQFLRSARGVDLVLITHILKSSEELRDISAVEKRGAGTARHRHRVAVKLGGLSGRHCGGQRWSCERVAVWGCWSDRGALGTFSLSSW